jgi:hypothetical protein
MLTSGEFICHWNMMLPACGLTSISDWRSGLGLG